MRTRLLWTSVVLPLFLLANCNDEELTDAPAEPTSVALNFAALVGGAPLTCDEDFAGFGPDGDRTLRFVDARLYLHDVQLQASDGTWVAATIPDSAPFQGQGVALLDFENGTGECANGNAELNSTVTVVPTAAGEWQGVRFNLGVPFELNHADASAAASPLNLTSLFWNWQGGYKFARIDVMVDNGAGETTGFNMHLGSTGCDGAVTGGVTSCANENRPVIELTGADPAATGIQLNVDAIYSDLDPGFNTPDSAPGCMSGPTDPECTPVFNIFGLGSNAQTFIAWSITAS
jgi:uncharacterized repeat protein (TIGR04052 family)